jgi:hypothetical protein
MQYRLAALAAIAVLFGAACVPPPPEEPAIVSEDPPVALAPCVEDVTTIDAGQELPCHPVPPKRLDVNGATAEECAAWLGAEYRLPSGAVTCRSADPDRYRLDV